jgi:hypothetical protein
MKFKRDNKEYNYNYRALWVSPEVHHQIRYLALKNETTVDGAITILLKQKKSESEDSGK